MRNSDYTDGVVLGVTSMACSAVGTMVLCLSPNLLGIVSGAGLIVFGMYSIYSQREKIG